MLARGIGGAGETRDIEAGGRVRQETSWSWLGAILVAGLLLRVILIDRQSLFLDEAISWRFAHFPLRALWTEVLDTHPPLYYALLHVWLVFGESEAALRSLSVLCGVAAIALTYALGRQLSGDRTGLVAAALMATSALQLEYSQNARSYELLTAAALGASIGLVGVLRATAAGRRPTMPVGGAYVAGMVIALYAHNIAALLLGVAGFAALADCLRRRSLRTLATWCGLNALVLAAWSYWLPVVWHQGRGRLPELEWLPPPDLGAVAASLDQLYGPAYVYFLRPITGVIALPLALFGAFLYRRAGLPILYLVALAFGVPLLEIAISHLGRPVFMTRTVMWVAPYIFVLVALSCANLRAGAAVAALAMMAALQLVGVANYERLTRLDPWRETMLKVSAAACPGDVMILGPYYIEAPFGYYALRYGLEARVLGAYSDSWRISLDPRRYPLEATNVSAPDATVLAAPRVWIILDDHFAPAMAGVLAMLQSEHREVERFAMITTSISLYALPGAACGRVPSSPG